MQTNKSAELLLQDAVELHQAGDLFAAEIAYRKLLEQDTQNINGLHLLGVCLFQKGDSQSSAALIEQAIKINPHFPEFYINLVNALQTLEQYEAAELYLKKSIAINSHFIEAYIRLGNLLVIQHKYTEALRYYLDGLKYDSHNALLYNYAGMCLQKLNRDNEAIAYYQKSISYDPQADVYYNMGVLLSKNSQLNEAIEAYQKAITIDPLYQKAYFNGGNAHYKLNQFEEAIHFYSHSLAINPNNINVLTNRGDAFMKMHLFDKALSDYHMISEIAPTYKYNDWNLSLCQLSIEDYQNGFKNYESRWDTIEAHRKRSFAEPLWLGEESLTGKSILIHGEQGFGDTIQFLRYVEKVAALGADVFLDVDTSLHPILEDMVSNHTIKKLLMPNSTLPHIDYQCPIMSLALAFKTTIDTIPQNIPYCFSKKTTVAQWRSRLKNTPQPKIGITWWSSNPAKILDDRYMALKTLISVIPSSYLTVSLQKEINQEDLNLLAKHPHILHFESELVDFGDTAALIEQMDLIITIDTSVAHLTGAMGKPFWLMLPYNTDWRWSINRTDSPWYPTARLFRQQKNADWNNVIHEIKQALLEYKK